MTYYKSEFQRSFTWEGKVGSTTYGFLDVTVALDFVLGGLQKVILGLQLARDKVPTTDEDIAQIGAVFEGVIDLLKGDKYKMIAPGTPGDPNDPVPTVRADEGDIDPRRARCASCPTASELPAADGASTRSTSPSRSASRRESHGPQVQSKKVVVSVDGPTEAAISRCSSRLHGWRGHQAKFDEDRSRSTPGSHGT
jgi:hypothetical protein